MDSPIRLKRGFAQLPAEVQRAIAAKGGKAAQASGRAHRFTLEEARAAARKSAEVRSARARAWMAGQVPAT